ncbi:hypothetical protein ACFL1X_09890 [Candidatus Hydrogenedentota bacterium]
MVAREFMGMHGIVSITVRLLSSIPATMACVGVGALHTTFDVRSGGTEMHSNAWTMRQFFGIGLGHKNTPFERLKTEMTNSFW